MRKSIRNARRSNKVSEIIMEALRKANKLGRQGQRIVAVIEPHSAAQSPFLVFATTYDEPKTASERAWWEQ